MRICGSENCAKVIALGCFITTATLVALACLHASAIIRGIDAYKIAVACSVSALIPAIAGAILCIKKDHNDMHK